MTYTPNKPCPTDQQVSALRNESGQAGDTEMVNICDDALAGVGHARIECGHAIAEALSMGRQA